MSRKGAEITHVFHVVGVLGGVDGLAHEARGRNGLLHRAAPLGDDEISGLDCGGGGGGDSAIRGCQGLGLAQHCGGSDGELLVTRCFRDTCAH